MLILTTGNAIVDIHRQTMNTHEHMETINTMNAMNTVFSPVSNQGAEKDPKDNMREKIILSVGNSEVGNLAEVEFRYVNGVVIKDKIEEERVLSFIEKYTLTNKTVRDIETITVKLPR